MNQQSAEMRGLPPRGHGHTARPLLGAVLAVFLMTSWPVRAEEGHAVEPPPATETPSLLPTAPAPPAPANPALDVGSPDQAPPPSVFRRWWFWTAVGAAAAITVVAIVASSRGDAPPATDLGNQEFRP